MLDVVPIGVTTDLDGNPRVADCVVDLGAYERPGVPAAALTSAISIKNCDLNLLPELKSEPRQPGITEILLGFDLPLMNGDYAVSAGGPGGAGVTLEEASCADPTYAPYSGSLQDAFAFSGGNTLFISVPALTNARTYRFNLGPNITSLPNQEIEVRGLIGDVNSDGSVNALDRAVVIGAWTGAGGFSCNTDVNNDGSTNALDRAIVIGAWTGAANCAPNEPSGLMGGGCGGESMSASAGEAPLTASGFDGSSSAGSEDVSSGSHLLQLPLVVEIRPAGGGSPVTVLTSGDTYQIHYSGATHPVQGYSLRISGACDGLCLGGASPASTGMWSQTGLFEHAASPAGDFILDDLPPGLMDDHPEGHLCMITPVAAGELRLDLRTYLTAPETFTTYEMIGAITVMVVSP